MAVDCHDHCGHDFRNMSMEEKPSVLSKRQMKRKAKHEIWVKNKYERRVKEKEKRKARKLDAVLRGEVPNTISRKILKNATMENSTCKISVAVDLSFDNLMSDKDICKVTKQIQRCYSLNRRSTSPLQFYLTSFNGKVKQRLASIQGCMNWDVHFKEESFQQLFNVEDIVYLSSESPNLVEALDESKVYIIGGLVDHNHHKGLCHELAVKNNIAHCRLPIDEFVQMKSRKVLTIDQVFQILLGVAEGNSWEGVFVSVLPERKGAVPKTSEQLRQPKSEQQCAEHVTEST